MTLSTFISISANNGNNETVKFLYSYGGRILPRRTDGKLCYVGGHTRVLSVHRSVAFSELMVRFGELCGSSMNLKCKLPTEDLDVLVSITNEDDLTSIIEEYARYSSSAHKDLKIRAVLFPIEKLKKISPPISIVPSHVASPPSKTARWCHSYSPVAVGSTPGGWKQQQGFVPSMS